MNYNVSVIDLHQVDADRVKNNFLNKRQGPQLPMETWVSLMANWLHLVVQSELLLQ